MNNYDQEIILKHKKMFSRYRKHKKEIPTHFNFFNNLPCEKNQEKSFKTIDRALSNYKTYKNVSTHIKREDIVFVLHDLKNLDKLQVDNIAGILKVSNSTIRNWITKFNI